MKALYSFEAQKVIIKIQSRNSCFTWNQHMYLNTVSKIKKSMHKTDWICASRQTKIWDKHGSTQERKAEGIKKRWWVTENTNNFRRKEVCWFYSESKATQNLYKMPIEKLYYMILTLHYNHCIFLVFNPQKS